MPGLPATSAWWEVDWNRTSCPGGTAFTARRRHQPGKLNADQAARTNNFLFCQFHPTQRRAEGGHLWLSSPRAWRLARCLQYLNNLTQLVRQLAGQSFAKSFGEAAVIRQRLFFGLAEARPDLLANFGFSQITKDRARIVDLVCQRHAKDIVVSLKQVRQIFFLPLLPVRLALASCRVGQTILEQASTIRATRLPKRLRTSSSLALPP